MNDGSEGYLLKMLAGVVLEKGFKRIMDMRCRLSREGCLVHMTHPGQEKLIGQKWRTMREGIGFLITNINSYENFFSYSHLEHAPYLLLDK